MDNLDTILGGGGITGVLILGARWLINSFFQKQKENETLKHQNAIAQQNRLEDNIKSFRSGIDFLQSQLKDTNANLNMNRQEMITLKADLAATRKLVEDYSAGIDRKVENMIKTEIQNLTQKIMLIRSKKNGV